MNAPSFVVSPGGFSLGIWIICEQSSNSSPDRFRNSPMSRDLSMEAFQDEVGGEGRS